MKTIILRIILLVLLLSVAAVGVAEETADLTPADITASSVMPETDGDPGQEQGTQPVPEDAADDQNGSADLLKSENGTQSEEPDGGSAQAKGMTETQEENADTISETQPEITAEADAGYEPSEVAVFSAEVSIRVSPAGEIPENTMIILKALVSNATMDYTLRWEQHDPAKDQPDASAKWTVIGEENELRMTASMSLNVMEHRLHVTGADGTELFVPVPALVIKPAPEDTKLPADRPEAPETEKQEEIVSETDTEPPEPADEISADEETSDVATIDEPMIDEESADEETEPSADEIPGDSAADCNDEPTQPDEKELAEEEIVEGEPEPSAKAPDDEQGTEPADEQAEDRSKEPDDDVAAEPAEEAEAEIPEEPNETAEAEPTADAPEETAELPAEEPTDEQPTETDAEAVEALTAETDAADEQNDIPEAGSEIPTDEAPETEAKPVRSVSIQSSAGTCITCGETIILTAELEGFDPEANFTVVWEIDQGNGWEEAGTGETFEYTASLETLMWDIRVTVRFIP